MYFPDDMTFQYFFFTTYMSSEIPLNGIWKEVGIDWAPHTRS